jgi:hypothetical protein
MASTLKKLDREEKKREKRLEKQSKKEKDKWQKV